MIRPMRAADLDAVAELWLDTNLQAHAFIDPQYWRDHFEEVKTLLSQAELYVWEDRGALRGFIGLEGSYVAGLFVRRDCQSQGTGRALLDFAKDLRPRLELKVYRNNPRAAAFYRREGFLPAGESLDHETGQMEIRMVWAPGERRG